MAGQIRRGLKAALPALALAEVGFCTDTKEVYIGDGSDNIRVADEIHYIKPEWYGAEAGDATDCTTAVQAAIDALPAGGGVVLFGPGTYRITGTLNIDEDRIHLRGQGQRATFIHFVPSGADTCFYFHKDAGEMWQNSIESMGIYSEDADGDFTKVAIDFRDTGYLRIYDIAINPWRGNDASIGIKCRGRDMTEVRSVVIGADYPISIEDNPESTIDLDHAHFSDLQLISYVGPIL